MPGQVPVYAKSFLPLSGFALFSRAECEDESLNTTANASPRKFSENLPQGKASSTKATIPKITPR
jgi:hypothetical protein